MSKVTTITALETIPDNHIPKPSKQEIINALVERARQRHSKECEGSIAKRDAVWDLIKAEAAKQAKAKTGTTVAGVYQRGGKVEVEVLVVPSDRLNALFIQYYDIPRPTLWDERAARKEIMDEINVSSGKRLLADAAMVKSMDEVLTKIGL